MTKVALTTKPVVVTVAGTDFTFTPTVQDANNHTNDLMPNNKVAPAYTYLTRTVQADQKEALIGLIDTVPGLTIELFATVSIASKGGIEITLKK
ncbi:putative phage tail assembly chaperone [Photobacterium frigidiphilum]|uniref:putative phage tail assembly chaperone n=1 Tax=Photobacterium frigidiphilum TaxID=264736 RepID=UPI003D0C2272